MKEKIIQIEKIGGESQLVYYLTNKGRVIQSYVKFENGIAIVNCSDITINLKSIIKRK